MKRIFSIKYVSADGLTRYEPYESESMPREHLCLFGSYFPWSPSFAGDGLPRPTDYVRRCYRLADHYYDPQNGREIFEYRETQ